MILAALLALLALAVVAAVPTLHNVAIRHATRRTPNVPTVRTTQI